ncbi:MAG: hypothetical protein AB7Q23_11100 [Hyphomonadaceae bacterium]
MRSLVLVAALALAACGGDGKSGESATTTAEAVAPSGPPQTVALAEGDQIQHAASVSDVAQLQSGAKIFSTVGGDPAMNGLYTYIAVYGEAPDVAWRVFQIGDFNSWSVHEDRGNEVVLKISRNWMDQSNGQIGTLEEYLIVTTPNATSTSVTVTPAQ